MKVCGGTWPDTGTPCLRPLDANGKCPKLHAKDHLDGIPRVPMSDRLGQPESTGHKGHHVVIDVDSCVTGEIIARYCVTCEERVDNW